MNVRRKMTQIYRANEMFLNKIYLHYHEFTSQLTHEVASDYIKYLHRENKHGA